MNPIDERKGGTSASSAAFDLLCQGRHQAQANLPEIKSKDADFGNKVHAAFDSGEGEELDAAQASVADSALEIEAKLMAQVFGPDTDKVKTFKEERFWTKVPLTPDGARLVVHSGKPDKVHRLGPVAAIWELKALTGDKGDPAANQQLRDYVVLVARALLCNEVYVAVIQPLVTHSPTLVRYDEAAISQAEQELIQRVRNSHADNAPRTAGDMQCNFCRAKRVCPEYAVWSKSQVPEPVSLFDVPMASWSPEQCATFLERRAFAYKWLKEAEDHLKDRLNANPEAIPGWWLEPGDTRRTITDLNELHGRFLACGGNTTQFMECMDLTKKEFEKRVRAATKLKGKGLEAKMQELFQGIVEEKQNAPSLARKKGT